MTEAQEAIASESEVAATLEQSALTGALAENLSPGAVLSAARELQGLALERIADDLHLSKQVIEAIEADQYAVFSAPVFAKGHLRRYAVRLGIAADDVIARYERLDTNLQSRVSTPRLAETTRNIDISTATASFRISPRGGSRGGASRTSSVMWVIAALILIGTFIWTVKDHFVSDPGATSTVTTVTTPIESEVAAQDGASAGADASSVTVSSAGSLPVAQSTSQTAVTTSTVAPAIAARSTDSTKLRIQLRFTQDSWVEITDSTSKMVLYEVGHVDLPRVIDVVPPARVLLGNAPAVSVQVNGKPLNIPAHRVVNAVARFTINADGTVR